MRWNTVSSKNPDSARATSDAAAFGAESESRATTNVPHDVSNVSVQDSEGSSVPLGAVSPPSARGAGAATSAHATSAAALSPGGDADGDVAAAMTVVGGAASSSSPQAATPSATAKASVRV